MGKLDRLEAINELVQDRKFLNNDMDKFRKEFGEPTATEIEGVIKELDRIIESVTYNI